MLIICSQYHCAPYWCFVSDAFK